MLGRIQRYLVGGLLLLALILISLNWSHSPTLCWLVALLFLTWHLLFLALEFGLAHWVNRHDGAQRAGLGLMILAWVGESLQAPRVFAWRQPFRSNALPDQLAQAPGSGRQGVVFVHGFFCNRGFWNPWLQQLQRSGHVYAAVNLEPVFGSINDYAPIIDSAVKRVTAATGVPALVICHSMGGLAVRAWLRSHQADALVAHVVTIGTPHQGTWLGRLSPTRNGRQMRLASRWLAELAQNEPEARRSRFTCYYSNCDNIVFPTLSATLTGADNRFLPGVAHVALAFDERVMNESLARLSGTLETRG